MTVPAVMLLTASLHLPRETNYFAVTATDANGLESSFSNEVSFVRTNFVRRITLAWGRSMSPNVTYMVYKGPSSHFYTNSYPAGTNLTLTLPLFPPPLTNVVLTVTGTGAIDIMCGNSLSPSSSWNLLGTNNWTATNPPSPLFFRAIGRNSAVTIRARMQ